MKLKDYTRKTIETFGMRHLMQLAALRYYLKTTSIVQLAEEIGEIEDARQLRALWEAGLSAELQEVVLKRLNKIT